MIRVVSIVLSGSNSESLVKYAELIADLVDDAMQSQEETNQVPPTVKYDGVTVDDPDASEVTETITPEIVPPVK